MISFKDIREKTLLQLISCVSWVSLIAREFLKNSFDQRLVTFFLEDQESKAA
jgi:hypothetical protein